MNKDPNLLEDVNIIGNLEVYGRDRWLQRNHLICFLEYRAAL